MPRGRSRWAALLGACLILAPSLTFAAPTAQEKSAAKTAWTLGKRLQTQGKDDEAVIALREAVDKDPKAQYQLDLARALVKTKSYLDAKKTAEAVVATTEPNTQRAKQAAQAIIKEVSPKIPTLKITIEGPAATGASATIDGESVEVGKERSLDPGSYEVRARSSSGAEKSESVTLAEGEHRVVTLTLADAAPTEKKEETSSGGGNMAPAAVLYGVGGAGLVVGAVLGVLAFQKTSEVQDLCGGNVCPPEYSDDVALAQDYGTGSTVAFAIGGLGVAAAIILTVTVGLDHGPDTKKDELDKNAFQNVQITFGAGSIGLRGQLY